MYVYKFSDTYCLWFSPWSLEWKAQNKRHTNSDTWHLLTCPKFCIVYYPHYPNIQIPKNVQRENEGVLGKQAHFGPDLVLFFKSHAKLYFLLSGSKEETIWKQRDGLLWQFFTVFSSIKTKMHFDLFRMFCMFKRIFRWCCRRFRSLPPSFRGLAKLMHWHCWLVMCSELDSLDMTLGFI